MSTHSINQKELSDAIIKLNSMSRAQGIVMDREGHIKTGNQSDEDTLCLLIPAPVLAKQLTAAGLSSYSGKELQAWADAYDITALEKILSTLNS